MEGERGDTIHLLVLSMSRTLQVLRSAPWNEIPCLRELSLFHCQALRKSEWAEQRGIFFKGESGRGTGATECGAGQWSWEGGQVWGTDVHAD